MRIPCCSSLPAALCLPLLLLAGLVLPSAAEHPLATVTRRLPTVNASSQVTEADGNVMIRFAYR
jgi:hypothetical protein